MLCLDNSVLSRFAQPDPDPAVTGYLKSHASREWTVPALVAFEYYRTKQSQPALSRARQDLNSIMDGVLPVTDDVAAEAVGIANSLSNVDAGLDVLDLLHAATARDAGATFVTADRNDFDTEPVRQLLDVDVIHV